MVHKVIEANDSGSVRQTTYMESRLVNAEVIFAIDFEICFLRRLKVKSSDIVWSQKKSPKNLDDLHFSGHRFVLHLTGLFQKFDFPGQLTFQSSTTYNSVIHPTTYIKMPLEFIIAYERSKDKKKATESRHAIHKTDHKQNYYKLFLYKDKLGLHLIWKKTLSEDFQKV
ncbi:hypothetical protein IGI04_030035 [Brassica rapa subsp. trilocularis]|uniref:Uncharacterized protein n=1 Tax=Brassica rapa subsp. trilocularis TaxID=1813537 RepID=A0ABQ7LPM6_BRACM|nr:hypothetical protein IGI04_030035 [Brassica rapa subsp. trilocularis]